MGVPAKDKRLSKFMPRSYQELSSSRFSVLEVDVLTVRVTTRLDICIGWTEDVTMWMWMWRGWSSRCVGHWCSGWECADVSVMSQVTNFRPRLRAIPSMLSQRLGRDEACVMQCIHEDVCRCQSSYCWACIPCRMKDNSCCRRELLQRSIQSS